MTNQTIKPRLTARHLRLGKALINAPLTREQADRVAGASNSPQIISELRKKGLEAPCDLIPSQDRDGTPCKHGLYSFTDDDKAIFSSWIGG